MKKDYTKILELQNELSKNVINHDDLINNNISNVCGIDVSILTNINSYYYLTIFTITNLAS
jgi:hypothetical protein